MAMEYRAYPVGPIQTNCYLIRDTTTGKGAVIDPGDEGERLVALVKASGMDPAAILLTHGHYDHTGGIGKLKAAYPGLPVYLHDGDAALAGNPAAHMPHLDQRTASYGEGDVIPVGALRLEVLHTPGHTPGSITLKAEGVLFTGDTLFKGSMGRTDLVGGSDEEILRSLKKLALLPGDYQVCPGHEAPSTLETERKQNYYMKAAMNR